MSNRYFLSITITFVCCVTQTLEVFVNQNGPTADSNLTGMNIFFVCIQYTYTDLSKSTKPKSVSFLAIYKFVLDLGFDI